MRRSDRSAWAAVVLALLTLGGAARGATWPPPEWTPVDRAAWPTADAVVLLDEGRLLFEKQPRRGFWLTRTVRLQVLTPAGSSRADVRFVIDRDTRVESFDARSFGPDGADLRAIGQTALVTAPAQLELGAGAGRPSVVSAVVPAVDVGDIIEYRYSVHVSRGRALPDWIFGGRDPTLESRFQIQPRDDLLLAWSGAEGGRSVKLAPALTQREAKVLEWRRVNLPPLPPRAGALPDVDAAGQPLLATERAARLRVVLLTDPRSGAWDRVATAFRELHDRRGPLPPEAVEALTRDLVGRPPREQLAALADRVIVRWPAPPHFGGPPALGGRTFAAIWAAPAAEPEELASVFVAAARSRGFEAWLAPLASALHGPIDLEVPTVAAFDHMIAAVRLDDGWLFVDPSDRAGVPGELRDALDGRPALLVGPDTIAWQTLPTPPPGRLTTRWTVADDGGLTLVARAEGRAAAPWRRPSMRGINPRAQALEALLGGLPSAAVEAVDVRPDPEAAGAVRISATARWPALWTPLGAGAEGLALGRLVRPASGETEAAERVVIVELPWPMAARPPDLRGEGLAVERAESGLRITHRAGPGPGAPLDALLVRSRGAGGG